MHNVYSLILRRLANEATSSFHRFVFNSEATKMEIVKKVACQRADLVLAVSAREAEQFETMGARNVEVIPNGVDCKAVRMRHGAQNASQSILFVGAMDWQPNISAALYLATQVFPELRKERTQLQLFLVGKDPPLKIQKLVEIDGVNVTGTVSSVEPYWRQASVFAVPLDSGGGTRLKILEAFASGVPVVSTAVGAEGIDAVDGTHLVIAERSEMVKRISELLNEPSTALSMTEAARELVEFKYDWRMIGDHAHHHLHVLRSGACRAWE